VESLAEIDPRKVAEVVRRSRDRKNNASATHFFAFSPKPLETCKAESFQASTPPAKFHPNPSKCSRFISENGLPDRYNNRRSVIRRSSNVSCSLLFSHMYDDVLKLENNLEREKRLRADVEKNKRKLESDLRSTQDSVEELERLKRELEETVRK